MHAGDYGGKWEGPMRTPKDDVSAVSIRWRFSASDWSRDRESILGSLRSLHFTDDGPWEIIVRRASK